MTAWPKPTCPYCGAQSGLRIQCDGGGYMEPDYICEACFRGTDDGPCFDDLKPVGEPDPAPLAFLAGIRNALLLATPFWLAAGYFVGVWMWAT